MGFSSPRPSRHLSRAIVFLLCAAAAAGEVGLPADLKLTGGKKIPVKLADEGEDVRLVSGLKNNIADKRGKVKGFREGASDLRETKKDKILRGLDERGIDGELGLDTNRIRGKTIRAEDKRRLGNILEGPEDKKRFKGALDDASVSEAYEKNKGLLSKLLNLMGADVGPDPLQDLMDDVNKQADATTEVVDDVSVLVQSSLENLLIEKLNVLEAKLGVSKARKGILDAAMENEADRWKAILKSYVKLEKGFSGVKQDIKRFQSDICKPAEFIPPERIPATFSGIGASLEFSAGSCEVDLEQKFLKWELVLKCIRPSIKYTKHPPMYVSEHNTASEYRTRECKKERILGDEIEEVLHIFGGQKRFSPEILKGRLGQDLLGIGTETEKQANPMANILIRILGDKSASLFDSSPKPKLRDMDILSRDIKPGVLGINNLKPAGQGIRKKMMREKLIAALKNRAAG